jgi:Icc-related predicted phosphoesterase
MSIKVLHVSDCHGTFPAFYGEFDVIVCSGDLLPNKTRGNRHVEPAFQKDWVRKNEQNFKNWIGDKLFLFCPGNHDFIDPCSILREFGLNAHNITDKIFDFMGKKFYGFPYIPFMGNEWNFELFPDAMGKKVDTLVNLINNNMYKHNCGNRFMANALSYRLNKLPIAYLHGHIHESYGITNFETMLISNAATVWQIISI